MIGTTVMSVKLGTTAGGTEIMPASALRSANDIAGPAAGSGPSLAALNAARAIYFSAAPGPNWNMLSGGRWAIMLTYIDYGAVYAQRAP